MVDGQELPAFRGDNVNSFEPDGAGRQPDPSRLVKGDPPRLLALHDYYLKMLQGTSTRRRR